MWVQRYSISNDTDIETLRSVTGSREVPSTIPSIGALVEILQLLLRWRVGAGVVAEQAPHPVANRNLLFINHAMNILCLRLKIIEEQVVAANARGDGAFVHS